MSLGIEIKVDFEPWDRLGRELAEHDLAHYRRVLEIVHRMVSAFRNPCAEAPPLVTKAGLS